MNNKLLGGLCLLAVACQDTPKQVKKMDATEKLQKQIATDTYPENFLKVLDAHGGLETWKTYNTLGFDLPKPDFTETYTIDLSRRLDKITASSFSLGYDGTDVWLLDSLSTYEGNPIFYHNLMFYFYAMPFVLADKGINYEETKPLEVAGVSYPGFKISFDTGVGTSSKDEYYLHYDAVTFKMKWLGYTVTYFSNAASDKISWINYGDWIEVEDVLLPSAITWYTVENAKIAGPAKTVNFENVTLSKKSKPDTFYSRPEAANIIEE